MNVALFIAVIDFATTAPVKLTRRWVQVPNGRLLPYECNEEMWQARLEELASKAGVPLP